MQWNDSRNAGFSTAPPDKVYLPVIEDDVYGYRRVNVTQADQAPDSLLNWVRHALQVRSQHPAFGRGELQTLPSFNPAIFAYIRSLPQEKLLVVNNLSAHPQIASLRLDSSGTLRDLESGETLSFDRELQLDLPRYGYRWFEILEQ